MVVVARRFLVVVVLTSSVLVSKKLNNDVCAGAGPEAHADVMMMQMRPDYHCNRVRVFGQRDHDRKWKTVFQILKTI